MLVVGGGIAGLSLAARIAGKAPVTILEAEENPGFHATGRSATMLHYALGDPLVRNLTLASRPFFDDPPEGFDRVPLSRRTPLLVFAQEDELEALERLQKDLTPFASLQWLDAGQLRRLCPVLKAAAGLLDPDGLRLDPNALLQGHLRALRAAGGAFFPGARLRSARHDGTRWTAETEDGRRFEADLLVNAAGAWADLVAKAAGVAPLGLQPLRRTVILFDPPPAHDAADWPFVRSLRDRLYFAPEAGRLLASPMDEVPSAPCDAQPDEYEVALAAHQVEQCTTMRVERICGRWAGLRTFAPDRHPVVGFDRGQPGFFWLAGQGGFGLQTSPALSAAAAALILGEQWPLPTIKPAALGPDRFAA